MVQGIETEEDGRAGSGACNSRIRSSATSSGDSLDRQTSPGSSGRPRSASALR